MGSLRSRLSVAGTGVPMKLGKLARTGLGFRVSVDFATSYSLNSFSGVIKVDTRSFDHD